MQLISHKLAKSTLVVGAALSLLSAPVANAAQPTQVKLSEQEKQSIRQDVQRAKDNKFIVPNDPIDARSLDMGFVTPFGENPGTGATRVNLVTYGYYGELVDQDNKSGTFDLIKDSSMFVIGTASSFGGAITGTVGGILLPALDLALSMVDGTKAATAKTQLSFTYPTKEGQVYHSGGWFTHFESTSRNIYKHTYATAWDKNKNIRQETKDYTPANGYSAIRLQPAPNYNNNTSIQNKAYTNYLQGKKTTEDWLS